MDWFLYDIGLRHESVKMKQKAFFTIFKGFSAARNCLSIDSVPLRMLKMQMKYKEAKV